MCLPFSMAAGPKKRFEKVKKGMGGMWEFLEGKGKGNSYRGLNQAKEEVFQEDARRNSLGPAGSLKLGP